MKTKYTYRDFETKKPRWTRGQFREWTEPTGLLNVRYAVIDRERSELFIPEYCLTPETRRAFEYEMKFRELPAKLLGDNRMERPANEHKHLVAIHPKKRQGYFVVNNPERCLNREAMKEIYAEATEEGLDKSKLHIYGCTACYFGPGIDFIQVQWDYEP
jgi:hypothetical protein